MYLICYFCQILRQSFILRVTTGYKRRDARYCTLKYLKFHGNFEIFQDPFFEIFHEIFNFHYKMTSTFKNVIKLYGVNRKYIMLFMHNNNYTVSQKNYIDVTHYRFNPHQPISVIFGRDVAERV